MNLELMMLLILLFPHSYDSLKNKNCKICVLTIPVVASMHSESWLVGKKTTAGSGSDWTSFERSWVNSVRDSSHSYIQVFFNWYPPKKYGKPMLGVSTLT